MLTEIEKKLIRLLEDREVDDHTCVGIILTLDIADNLSEMYDWIKQNPSAGQTEIMRHKRAMLLKKSA